MRLMAFARRSVRSRRSVRGGGSLERPWTRRHRAFDRLDIRFDRALRPGCVGTQHRRDAVPVLLGNPEGVPTDHQIPADRGVASAVGPAIADPGVAQERPSPTAMGILKYPDRTAGRFEEKPIVVDLPRALNSLSQFKLSSHDVQGSSAQRDPPILSRLGRVLVDSRDTRLIDFERPVRDVEISHEESYLLGRVHPGEEPEFIVVALCVAPIPVDSGDERLRFLDLTQQSRI